MILLLTGTGALYGLLAAATFLMLLSADDPPYDLGGWSIAAIPLGIVVGSSLLGAVIGALSRRFGWLGKKLKPSPMTTVRLARAGIGLVALLLVVTVVAGSIFVRSKWDEGIQQSQAVLGAGVCAVIAASLAFIAAVLNAVETGANRVQTHSREVERALHERYSAAADQLGDADATFAKRIGGVYALAAVADDWLEYDPTRTFEAEVAVDLMCAYLRANTTQRRGAILRSAAHAALPARWRGRCST
ncbi:hypothetical protein ACFVKB_41320 [Rhodococcus sp. NPDC127530]|uniref:hypothetical protein n=1 Tax=unclassified Rhodococcus (in: high G+C Gram-positive bacteria) TaxID=192944 RepID=UPI00362539C6